MEMGEHLFLNISTFAPAYANHIIQVITLTTQITKILSWNKYIYLKKKEKKEKKINISYHVEIGQ